MNFIFFLNFREALKLKVCINGVETPYGWYFPDFETDDCYLEIKSNYTAKVCLRSKQLKKISWVSENIKKVYIKVLKGKDVDPFIKSIDLKDYLHISKRSKFVSKS